MCTTYYVFKIIFICYHLIRKFSNYVCVQEGCSVFVQEKVSKNFGGNKREYVYSFGI